MPLKSSDLYGSAPDKSYVALLIIDMINDLEFEGGEELLEYSLPVARNILKLKESAKKAGVPVIYVNDNFGKWRSDFNALVRHCLEDGVRGKPLVEILRPVDDDYFVLKPKHSGFFSSTLDILLEHLEATTLILTGIAGENCVLFTAADAYLRDYALVIPPDCVASIDPEDNRRALRLMEKVLKADLTPSQSSELVHRLNRSNHAGL